MSVEEQIDRLTSQFSAEISQLQKLQEAAEAARDKRNRETQDQLATILMADAAEKTKRGKLWTQILTTVAGLIVTFATFVTYKLATYSPAEQQVKDAVDKVEASSTAVIDVRGRIDAVESRLDKGDQIHERIVDIQLRQQVQMTDTTDYLSDKIDKINPRARTVAEPPSVTAGRKIADDIKKKTHKPQYDPADPLADLAAAKE